MKTLDGSEAFVQVNSLRCSYCSDSSSESARWWSDLSLEWSNSSRSGSCSRRNNLWWIIQARLCISERLEEALSSTHLSFSGTDPQFYAILGVVQGKVFPISYAFLKGKAHCVYKAYFSALNEVSFINLFSRCLLYRQALRSAGVSQECFLIMDYEAPALKAAKVFGFAIRGMIFFRRFFDVEILTGCCFHLIKNVNLRAHRCGLRLQCSDHIVAEWVSAIHSLWLQVSFQVVS